MSQKSRRTRSQFAKSDTSTHSTGGLPDEGAGHRQARLEHILLDELQSLIADEATDPSLDGIKILAVHLSADGGHARVAYAVAALLSREQEVGRASKDGLVRATGSCEPDWQTSSTSKSCRSLRSPSSALLRSETPRRPLEMSPEVIHAPSSLAGSR